VAIFNHLIHKSSTNESPVLRNTIANRLLTTSEEHFSAGDSEGIYSAGPAKYSLWSRYLEVFDEVVVLARVRQSHGPEGEQHRAGGPGVSFRALPDYTGPWQYLRARHTAGMITREAIAETNFYLLRVPGFVSQMVWHEILALKKPYAVEVLGDPWDSLSPGSWPNILRPPFRLMATHQLKRICAGGMAVNYVTSHTLQRRYPPPKDAYAVGFSDVSLEKIGIAANTLEQRHLRLRERPWIDGKKNNPLRIGFVGSFALLYKGPDVLLRAASLCPHHINFHLQMIGDGRYLPEMKILAAKLGIEDRVQFPGQVSSGSSIFNFLDSIDLFVMPSRQEGLPRALVEAMSRGCPCIASAVGGIPELLDASDLVPVGNPNALAKLILQVAADSNRLLAMSARNLSKAAQFNPETLNRSRRAFLEEVKNRSSPG
jgi:glycosyltransferase involved in cell wall biosynthesis